jgi:hypothetical protein
MEMSLLASDMGDEHVSEPLGAVPVRLAADMQDELLTAGTELDRLQGLLSDAVDQLNARFTQALSEQARLPHSPHNDAVSEQLRGALIALQFEDMASQIISHSRRRLASVADCLGNLVMGEPETDCDVQWVSRACPVAQRAVDAGSVELF